MTEPWPPTVSPEAAQAVAAMQAMPAPDAPPTTAQMRQFADAIQQHLGQAQLARYGVTLGADELDGVPVRTFAPGPEGAQASGGAEPTILLNLHGGGFMVDSGSMTENIALCARTRLSVVSALYRMAPEHPFPAAVDDALAVYRRLLRTHAPGRIGLYGTSAGAILAAQLLVRLKAEGEPLPAALGFFSGTADLARDGDCESYLPRVPTGSIVKSLSPYAGDTPRQTPALSPIFADLSGFPPTLTLASTRDQLLSHTAMFHRALVCAGVEAELIVFEALPHAFWAYIEAPETDEAFDHMARFFMRRLGQGGA